MDRRKRKLPVAIRGYACLKTHQLELACQYHCQETIQHGMSRIVEIINDAGLDVREEVHLLNVIAHTLGHIQGETGNLKSDLRGRVN